MPRGDVPRAERLEHNAAQLLCHQRREMRELDAGKTLTTPIGSSLSGWERNFPSGTGPQRAAAYTEFEYPQRPAACHSGPQTPQTGRTTASRSGTRAAQAVEIDAHLMYPARGRDEHGVDDVVAPVGADLPKRDLRAGEDDGFARFSSMNASADAE